MENSILTLTEATKGRRFNTSEKVIDGYLGDLPEIIRSNVMNIHKLIVDTSKKILDTVDYSDLKNDRRVMSQLEEFLIMPKDKDEVGSIRVYKRGKKYRLMIQMTGHFTNQMEDFNQELLHEFIKNVYVTIRPTVRKKYDFTITNEGDHGNPFEGFDVFPNSKIAEEMWNKLSDRNVKTLIKESSYMYPNYLMEMKTQEQYALEDFKRRYHYKDGYITVDGKKIKVDIDFKNPLMFDKYNNILNDIKDTGSIIYDPKTYERQVILDRSFFNVSDWKKREAILQHEIAHNNMQYGTVEDRLKGDALKQQKKFYSAAKKYEDPNINHLKVTEFEADRYAANRTSVHAVKSGLRQSYKQGERKYNKNAARNFYTRWFQLSDNEFEDEFGVTKKEYPELQNKAYPLYLKDPKYPSPKLTLDQFRKYFIVGIDDDDSLVYAPDDESLEDNEFLLKRYGSSLYKEVDKSKLTRDNIIKGESKLQRKSNNNQFEDRRIRAKALKDPNLYNAEYLKPKHESVEGFDDLIEFAEAKESLVIKPNEITGTGNVLPKGAHGHTLWANETLLEDILTTMQKYKDFNEIDQKEIRDLIMHMDARSGNDGFCDFVITKDGENYHGEIRLFPHSDNELGHVSQHLTALWNKAVSNVFRSKTKHFVNEKDPTKKVALEDNENLKTMVLVMSDAYARKLWAYCDNPRANPLNESYDDYEEFDEKSHGKLKHDFRLAVDVKTGHKVKLVYSTDGMEITQNNVAGDGVGFRKFRGGNTDGSAVADLKKYGNTDHQSKNQKLLAIEDLETGERLQEVTCKGPFGGKTNYDTAPVTLRVGDIDIEPRFKSTFWHKGGQNSIEDISRREGYRLRGTQGARVTELKFGYGSPFKSENDTEIDDLNKKAKFIPALIKVWEYINNDIKNQSLELDKIQKTKELPEWVASNSDFDKVENIYNRYMSFADSLRKSFYENKFDPNSIKTDYENIPKFTSLVYKDNNLLKSAIQFTELILNYLNTIKTHYVDPINERISGRISILKRKNEDIKNWKPGQSSISESYDYDEYEDDYITEASHGKLNSSFRIAANVENGHMIRIVFDLKPEDVRQLGDHANQDFRNQEKDKENMKKIRSIGSTDFSSVGTVKAIVDLDTKQNLQSVKTIGVIGSNSNTTRFTVPEKYQDPKLGDDSHTFSAYPVAVREQIAKELKLNPSDAITFTVGKRETVPSYKSTRPVNSTTDLYNSQWKKGKGIEKPGEMTRMNISTAVSQLEKRLSAVKPKVLKLNDDDLEDDINLAERMVKRLKTTMASNEGENFGQTAGDARYSKPYKTLEGLVADLEYEVKKHTPMKESADEPKETPEYNVDMSESEAKKTLGTVSSNIINSDKAVSQYTANIYANIITKNLLPIWAKGYRKLTITLDDHKNMNIFEFKLPSMNHDFVSRFIDGRETLTGFLHRNPEIKIRMSASLFKTMKNRDDGFKFFKNAITYYDHHAERYALKMMHEVMKLNHEMKHLVSTTSLSALVTYPMTLLFTFDGLDMSDKDCFKIHKSDITAINNFVKGIYSNYASPEKEKKKIVDDLKSMIKSFNESVEMDENIRAISYLPEAVDKFYSGAFDDQMESAHAKFIHENVNDEWPACSPDPEVKYLSEKFGVKKLKKIPRDLVAYIQIETESIKDANDKMMIASYCLSKLEIVEWYIELIEVGTKKYIVPHTKQELEVIRTQLLQCYKEIMAVKIKNPSDRPIIDIKYPPGYEG